MGKLLLCVENNVREVKNLLVFHNVHPQVRADVQRRLVRLVFQVQEYVETLRPGYDESPSKICEVIVREVLHNTIQHVIPQKELNAEERRSAALEQKTKELEAKLRASEQRCMEAEKALERFRVVHETVLRSYFREVLILRYQLHEATLHLRRARTNPLSTMHGARQQFAHSYVKQLSNNLTSQLLVPSASRSFEDADMSTYSCLYPDVAHNELSAQTASQWNETYLSMPDASDGVQYHQEGRSLVESTSPTHHGTGSQCRRTVLGKKVHISLGSHALEDKVPLQDFSKTEGKDGCRTVLLRADRSYRVVRDGPVNAIFDYEEYIRSLAAIGLLRSDEKESEAKGTGLPSMRSTNFVKSYLDDLWSNANRSNTLHADEAALAAEEARAQVEELLALVEKWQAVMSSFFTQEELMGTVNELRSLVQQLQQRYAEDICLLEDAMGIIQGRVDYLLSLLAMCTRSIRSVIPFITTDLCSLDGAQVPDASVASDSSAARRVSSPRTSGEFRVSSPVLGSGEHSVTSRGSLEQEIEASEGSQFWADNQIVIQAKEAVALLKRLRGRIRGQSRGRGGRLSANSLLSNFSDSPAFAGELRNASLHGGRSSLCRSAISDGLRQRRSEHSVRHSSSDSEWDKMLESLSRQELLKLLVRLRMRRIVSRSRLTSCMGHVSDAAQSGEDVRTIQNLLGRAWVHEEDIKKHSRRINKILHLLGLLEGALPPEPTYFSKNLLFSPYLIHPPHEVADDEDLVYVPVPVGSGYADSLRTSLEGESTGYVVFYDEIIPIARRVPHSFYNSSAVEGRPWGELDSGRSKRRIIPSFGSVMEYGGVQLGRPLVSMSDSEYTLWKLESYVLDDSVPTVSLRGQESARGGNMNSSVCSRNTRVSQVVLRSDILPLARSHTPAPAQLQFRWHPKIIEGLSPIFHSPPPHSRANDGVRSPVMTSNASRASVGSAHSTFPVANPQAPHRLLPLTCSSSPRLQQPCALQPNRDTRDLMSIQSLSTQQKRDEAQGQTSQPSSRVTEALSRLDEMRQERERMAANLRERRSPTTQIANQDSELRRRTETFMRFRLPTMANPEHANRNDEGGKGEDHKTR